jgi:circadian clock protein KaiC
VAESDVGVSSLMDSWLLLTNLEANGERTRTLQVLKSRGMEHSNQVREFVLGKNGINLIDVYRAGSQVLIGTARSTEQGRAGGQAAASRSSSLVTPRGRRAGKAAR